MNDGFSHLDDEGRALAVQADGKIVLAGVAQAFDPTNWLPGSWFPQVIRPAELASELEHP